MILIWLNVDLNTHGCGICWFTDMPIYYFVDFIEPDGVNLQNKLILFRPMGKKSVSGNA